MVGVAMVGFSGVRFGDGLAMVVSSEVERCSGNAL
jgi:hypothetical protein